MESRAARAEIQLISDKALTSQEIAAVIKSKVEEGSLKISSAYSKALSWKQSASWNLFHQGQLFQLKGSDVQRWKVFKLVSPRLQNRVGVQACADSIKDIDSVESINIDHKFGIHVHVSTEGLDLGDMVKLCQNFVKYEDAIDMLVPSSRRTGGGVCRSNKISAGGTGVTNKQRNEHIASCSTVDALVELLNRAGGGELINYKLDLRNLRKGGDPALEFTQHSFSSNSKKIFPWISLCLALVNNSARFRSPRALLDIRSDEEQFDALFRYIIKDDRLRLYFDGRRAELSLRIRQATASIPSMSASSGAAGERMMADSQKAPTDSKAECKCCLNQVNKDKMVSCQDRGHRFCRACVCRYADEELFGNHRSKLLCISTDGCASEFNTSQLEVALKRGSLKKLHRAHYTAHLEADGHRLSECPKCGCQGMMPRKQKTFCCPDMKCGFKSCRICHEPAHAPLKCSEVEKQFEVDGRIDVEEAMTSARIHRCDNCGTAIIRDGGCTEVTCANCNKSQRTNTSWDYSWSVRNEVRSAGKATAGKLSAHDKRVHLDGVVDRLM